MQKLKTYIVSLSVLLLVASCGSLSPQSSEATTEVTVYSTTVEEGKCPTHPIAGVDSIVEEHRFTFDAPAKKVCVARFDVTDESLTFDGKVVAGRDRCVSGTSNATYPRWVHYSAGNATAPLAASVKCVYLFEEPADIYTASVKIPTDSLDETRAQYQEYIEDILTRDGYKWSTGSRDLTRELQSVLGISTDGWYGNGTKAAHIAALEARGLPTTAVASQ